MRILPDKNFKANYKKRYDSNYEKLMDRRQKRVEQEEKQTSERPGTMMHRLVGGVVFATIVLAVVCVGSYLSGIYSDKESEVNTLMNEIQTINDAIKEYQIINSDEKYEQLIEAVEIVTDLQNQYVMNDFNNTFDAYAARYLGQYNENWADGISRLTKPVWRGYLDESCGFRSSAEMLFILCDEGVPVLVVNVVYDIDNFGNLGEMKRIDKMRLI